MDQRQAKWQGFYSAYADEGGCGKIIDAKYELLYLQAKDGTRLTFDVAKGAFVQ